MAFGGCSGNVFTLIAVAIYITLQITLRVVEERNARYVREEMLSELYNDEEHRERIRIRKHHSIGPYTPSPDLDRMDRRIMIAGLARNLEDVDDSVWATFRTYCDEFDASVHVQTRYVHEDNILAEDQLSNCLEVVLSHDAIATEGIKGIRNTSWEPLHTWGLFRKLGQRVQRITKARQGQLNNIRGYVAANQTLASALDAVVVVDMDMSTLPSSRDLRLAVDAVGLSGKWDAICADGLDATGNYYDSFATIVNFATFLTLPVHPYFRPLLHDANGFTYYYSWLMKRFQISIEDDSRHFVPVRSCFGGMAVYRAKKILDDSCSYHWSDEETDHFKITSWSGEGEVLCEHVRMHLCLEYTSRIKGHQFNIGISKSLKTKWIGEDE